MVPIIVPNIVRTNHDFLDGLGSAIVGYDIFSGLRKDDIGLGRGFVVKRFWFYLQAELLPLMATSLYLGYMHIPGKPGTLAFDLCGTLWGLACSRATVPHDGLLSFSWVADRGLKRLDAGNPLMVAMG